MTCHQRKKRVVKRLRSVTKLSSQHTPWWDTTNLLKTNLPRLKTETLSWKKMTKSWKLKRNLAVSLNNQWDSNWLKNFSLRKYTHNNKLPPHLSSKRMWLKTTSSTITQLMTISHLYRFLSKVSKAIRSKWQTSSFKSKESVKLPSFKQMSESLCKVKKTNRSSRQLKKKPKPSITYECAIFWTLTETMLALRIRFDKRWF